jgi:hypothetical protein
MLEAIIVLGSICFCIILIQEIRKVSKIRASLVHIHNYDNHRSSVRSGVQPIRSDTDVRSGQTVSKGTGGSDK